MLPRFKKVNLSSIYCQAAVDATFESEDFCVHCISKSFDLKKTPKNNRDPVNRNKRDLLPESYLHFINR